MWNHKLRKSLLCGELPPLKQTTYLMVFEFEPNEKASQPAPESPRMTWDRLSLPSDTPIV